MNETSEQQNTQAAQYVEEQLTQFHAAMSETCRLLHRLTPAHLRTILAAFDKAMGLERTWEDAAAEGYLTPRYFELSSELHAMRDRLACRLRQLEGKA